MPGSSWIDPEETGPTTKDPEAAAPAARSPGDPPRRRRVIRLIAAERFLRGLLLLAAGGYLLTHLGTDFGRIADHLARRLELDPHRPFLRHIVDRLHRLHARTIVITGIAALGYGVLEIVEGVGLWLDQLWAEYLTVIATSLLIPLEVYELIHKPSLLKTAGIAVNVAIVAYLVYALRKRLQQERQEHQDVGGRRLTPH